MDSTNLDRFTDEVRTEVAAAYGFPVSQLEVVRNFENTIFKVEIDTVPRILRMTHRSHRTLNQILAELDEDDSGGIDFAEFLRLATAKISEKDSRVEINKVFNSFDVNRAVTHLIFREK